MFSILVPVLFALSAPFTVAQETGDEPFGRRLLQHKLIYK